MRTTAFAAPLFLFVIAASFANCQTATLRTEIPQEDPKIRANAVLLQEQAVQASTPPSWTDVVIDTKFHLGNPLPGEAADGEHILTVSPWWKLRRHEWIYGSVHSILVRNGDLFTRLVSEGQLPPFAGFIENNTPIDLVRFNQQDVIHSITQRPNDSECIQFDSVFGDREQAGEICVDRQRHWMVSKKLGDVLTLYSRFVPFNNAYVPEHVERWVAGVPQIVFEQSVQPRTDFPADYFYVPENATIRAMDAACKEFRFPHPLDAPQPEPVSSAPTVTEIQLQGLVGANGHTSFLRALDNQYPDLNQQAIRIVSAWTFTPPTCDGKPSAWYTKFTVEFKGR